MATVHWFYVSQGFRYPRGWRKALCPDGKRRYVRANTIEPDTYFSHPASVVVAGVRVSGFVTGRDNNGEQDYEFIPYTYRKNHAVFA